MGAMRVRVAREVLDFYRRDYARKLKTWSAGAASLDSRPKPLLTEKEESDLLYRARNPIRHFAFMGLGERREPGARPGTRPAR